MRNQFQLFGLRRFSSMFGTQFSGAFNDNVFKQALILVLTYAAATKMDLPISIRVNLAALLFILPYFLFSALAGQIADKYEKSALTRKIKLLEISIMLIATLGFMFEIYWLLFLALFLTGTQSTLFGPVKYAYLPQAMKKDELVSANGLFQMGTSLSILLGMIVAGFLASLDNTEFWVSVVIIATATFGYWCSRQVPHSAPMHPDLKIDWNIFRTSWNNIKYLYSMPFLFFVIMGTSWFWFYGATFLNQTPEFTKVILHGDETVVILMLGIFSVGVSLGSVLCKTLTKNKISLKLMPFGILGLSVFTFELYYSLSTFTVPMDGLMNISQLLAVDGSIRVLVDLFCLGLSAGIYIVPLYALMQAFSPVQNRARIVGANNIFNALFMVVSAIFCMVLLTKFGLHIPQLFVITASMNLLFGGFLYVTLSKNLNTMTNQLD